MIQNITKGDKLMTIGERIKALRKKNDLTQEKLADYLRVSYQAVSKWECGIASPDISLIVPLTRILNVSADELFGLNENIPDKLAEELEKSYEETFRDGDEKRRLKIIESAIKELPGDMKWLDRYAWEIWSLAVCEKDDTVYKQQREKAIKLFETVIENCNDDEIKCSAITGIVQCLSGVDNERAKYYAELYPETKIRPEEKEELLALCLTGDERIKCEQHMLEGSLQMLLKKLLWSFDALYTPNLNARNAAETIIKTLIPDGNYQHYHHELFSIKWRNAFDAASNGDIEAAISYLKEAIYHAKAYDKLESATTRYSFTAPLFDKLEYDSVEWYKCEKSTLPEELINEYLQKPQFDILREREDFKMLIK